MTLAVRARAWRAQRRRAIVQETAALSAAVSLAIFGALALVDRVSALPRGARLAASAAWIAAMAWLAFTRAWKPWRGLDWDEVFAAAAREWPQTRPMLASAWALSAGAPSPGTSAALREEHLARADRLAADLPGNPLFVWTPSTALKRWAAAALAALAVNAAVGDRASWRRVVLPWRDAALERWIEIRPGDARVDWGGPAAISVRSRAGAEAAGARASAMTLETRGADGVWRPLSWTRADAASAEWRTESLSAPLDYRVRWRDASSASYRLEPVPPPRWAKAEAVVRDPRGVHRFALGEDATVRARRGDWIEIEAFSDGALASAALRAPGHAAPIEMRRQGARWAGGFPAQEDGALSFDLVSGDGRRDPSPPAYALAVAADAPPTAELLSPQVPLIASPQDSIPITYAARDDGAITRASLVVRAGGVEKSFPLPVPRPPSADVLGDYSWPLSGLAPGTRAEFWVEAWDDASPPQSGRSEHGLVEVVDAAADHAAALAARNAADAAVERAASSAEAARDAAAKGDLASSAERTRALKSDWAAASKALSEWANKSGADPRADPGLAEEASRAAEEFSRAGQDGLPAAEKALAASDAASAEREQGALAEQARGVQRAMREGAKAQEVQDFADKMAQAGKSSEGLAEQARDLAARGREGSVSPAELEKLEQALADIEKSLDELRKAAKSLPEISPEEASGTTRRMPMNAAREAAADLRRALQSGDVAGAAQAASRLAEKLKTLAQALNEAGRRAAESHGRRASESASRVKRAWQEAVESQTRAVEEARKVDNGRLARLLEDQRGLVRQAAADFDRELSSRAASGAPRQPGVDDVLPEAARRLKAGSAADAAVMMRAAASRLRAEGARSPGASEFARELDGIASRLEKGPPAPPADAAASVQAAGAQSEALSRARALRGEVQGASQGGYLSGRAARRVDSAISEEGAGESALRRGDSGEGLKRAESALSILQEGGQDADSASSAADAAGSSMGGGQAGVSLRAAPQGTTGTSLGRVRLPSADEYRPPRELREELERSLSEPRPAAHDPAIKEYFKRLSR